MPISNFTKVESLSNGINPETMTPKTSINSTRKHSNATLNVVDTPVSLYRETTKSEKRGQDSDPGSKRPVMNRIFCQFCRGLARPRIKMLEDTAWIPTSSRSYRTWAAEVKKALGQDGNKKLVILEIGCEKKLRVISDTLLKQTQLYGTVLMRINPAKAKNVKGSGQRSEKAALSTTSEQLILIEDDSCTAAIQKIDQALKEICEKIGFPLF